ncbi:glutaredoxin family protein [Glutamicibacter arilaitensis]|uniref:glutaredoxin family protein n=1 Tax=Glutamicibacter arilaitensis TaxID=256701 RepID=UPI003FCFD982
MLELFSKPHCGPCIGVKNYLKGRSAQFLVHDVTADPVALQRLKDLGYLQTPVLFDDQTGEHWYGLDTGKIDAAIAAQSAPAIAAS